VRALRRHLRLAGQFVRIGVIRKAQFRVEFFSQVLMDAVWYAAHLLVFEILFLHTPQIAGWSLDEVRVFLGFVFVADAFMMMWLGQAWLFGRELKDGKLDPVRVRPVSPVFLYFFQRFSLEACFNMLLAGGYLVYALASRGGGPWSWLALPWALALAFWSRTAITVLFSIVEFHVLHSDLSHFAHEAFMAGADRPLDVFTRRIRAFLLYVVPVGAMTYVPAALVLGRVGPLAGLLHTAWMVAFGLAVFAWWRRGFARYESAMS
jgi:ABC-2 type transport system permease protein